MEIKPGNFVTHVQDHSPAMVFATFVDALRLINEDGELFDASREEWVFSSEVHWGGNDYALSDFPEIRLT